MGKINAFNNINFKSSDFLFSKIRRQWKSFNDVGVLDDTDFPQYVAEVLKELGLSTYKEEDAVLTVKNGKAKLPDDFSKIYAAFKCGCSNGNVVPERHFQHRQVIEHDITCEVLGRKNNCEINCECPDKIIQRVTVKQYVNDGDCITRDYNKLSLLSLSPNVREHCDDNCFNIGCKSQNEISISNGYLLTNFNDGDIYLQYYAFPLDENNAPLIPDVIQVEKAIEWYIKYNILLNSWLVGDLTDVQNKWGKAEQEYYTNLAEAKYLNKLPSFAGLVNTIRNKRGINPVAFFSQIDRNR